MDAEGGGRSEYSTGAGRDELVAETLVEGDPEKLDPEFGGSTIVGIRIANEGRVLRAHGSERDRPRNHLGRRF